jgi:hypothetical protein
MSSRTNFRRKMVLPVTIIRRGGQEKQLAHTLDLTEASARLGGLTASLETGEVVEVQRGAVRAKFQVIWMGCEGSALGRQAGIRGLDPEKCIWNIDLPEDEVDTTVDTERLRRPMPPIRNSAQPRGERRSHPRYACCGSVAAETAGSSFATAGEARDISCGGVYVEVNAPLPVNSTANLYLCIEDISFEAIGVVRASYPLLGMGISFQTLTPVNGEKLAIAVERAKRRSEREQMLTSSPSDDPQNSETVSPEVSNSFWPGLSLDEDRAPTLLKACRGLAEDFERWKDRCSPAEMEEIRVAIDQLQKRFSPAPAKEFMEREIDA